MEIRIDNRSLLPTDVLRQAISRFADLTQSVDLQLFAVSLLRELPSERLVNPSQFYSALIRALRVFKAKDQVEDLLHQLPRVVRSVGGCRPPQSRSFVAEVEKFYSLHRETERLPSPVN